MPTSAPPPSALRANAVRFGDATNEREPQANSV